MEVTLCVSGCCFSGCFRGWMLSKQLAASLRPAVVYMTILNVSAVYYLRSGCNCCDTRFCGGACRTVVHV